MRRITRVLARSIAACAVALGLFAALAGTSHAATASRGTSLLAVAHTRAGYWYAYGAAGPSAFDCSGLVFWSAAQLGLSLPRDTYGMLASSRLVRTYHPVAGDLAFYGPGHVEIVDRGHDVTFGAQQPGTRVGDHTWSAWWHPTMFFEVT